MDRPKRAVKATVRLIAEDDGLKISNQNSPNEDPKAE